MRMKTRLYVEGKGLNEKWFSRVYAIEIFSKDAALRWIQSKTDVNMHSGEPMFRLFRVHTIMQMEFTNALHD